MAAIPNVTVKYVCDVEDAHGKAAVATLEKIQHVAPKHVVNVRRALDDKEVHALVVATPEHWHALAAVWACQAGKDVYCEKNISLSRLGRPQDDRGGEEVRPHRPGRLPEPQRPTASPPASTSLRAAWVGCFT